MAPNTTRSPTAEATEFEIRPVRASETAATTAHTPVAPSGAATPRRGHRDGHDRGDDRQYGNDHFTADMAPPGARLCGASHSKSSARGVHLTTPSTETKPIGISLFRIR